ncbi:MAG: universal stress protein [Betaproteobacteria bacterium]|nr:universal stress protein [Betaproteobacteria bacterium]MDE2003270.1 universal stress protein [Betaproteobacteria bacterium]MDE2208511.1 universal stress protein [Betaproteobacteria bacterium]MDE2359959.1 universal stress protein [Betaproteobacteria bacterium]
MIKVLLPVDGSASATRATRTLLATLDWYRDRPEIDLIAVHLPVPQLPHMGVVVSKDMLARYYDEECDKMLAPARQLLDAAGVSYRVHKLTGPIAETIVAEAKASDSDMIYMGTRGMTAIANMALGSVATRVLHLAQTPVVLVH